MHTLSDTKKASAHACFAFNSLTGVQLITYNSHFSLYFGYAQ